MPSVTQFVICRRYFVRSNEVKWNEYLKERFGLEQSNFTRTARRTRWTLTADMEQTLQDDQTWRIKQ